MMLSKLLMGRIQFNTLTRTIRLGLAIKIPKETGIIKVSTRKISDQLHGQLIYSTNKTKNLLTISALIVIGFTISAYIFKNDTSFMNLVPFGIAIGSVLIFQHRIMNTVKTIVVQKAGDRMILETYGVFGSKFFMKKVLIPIHIMSGFSKKAINKGIAIRGGGRYGISYFSYYFHESGIIDRTVFNNVVQGKQIQYTDKI